MHEVLFSNRHRNFVPVEKEPKTFYKGTQLVDNIVIIMVIYFIMKYIISLFMDIIWWT